MGAVMGPGPQIFNIMLRSMRSKQRPALKRGAPVEKSEEELVLWYPISKDEQSPESECVTLVEESDKNSAPACGGGGRFISASTSEADPESRLRSATQDVSSPGAHLCASGAQLIAKDVRGLQVGEQNYQLNTYRYEIEPNEVDLVQVFAQPEVQEALHRLAQDPNNPELEQAADQALRGKGANNGLGEVSVSIDKYESFSGQRGFLSFLFVSRSEGVQVGDNMRQENYFTYQVAPSINAAHLLATDSNLRSQILEGIRAVHSAGAFSDRLSDAVQGSWEAALGVQLDGNQGTILRPTAGKTLYAQNLDGVTVGWNVDQVNEVRSAMQIPRVRIPSDVPRSKGPALGG